MSIFWFYCNFKVRVVLNTGTVGFRLTHEEKKLNKIDNGNWMSHGLARFLEVAEEVRCYYLLHLLSLDTYWMLSFLLNKLHP
jgi:hypothetical protein